MTDDEGDNRPAHRGRQRCRPPPQSRSVTANTAFNDDLAPSLPPASSIAEPVRPRYSPDATVAGGRPAGQPWSPPPDARYLPDDSDGAGAARRWGAADHRFCTVDGVDVLADSGVASPAGWDRAAIDPPAACLAPHVTVTVRIHQ